MDFGLLLAARLHLEPFSRPALTPAGASLPAPPSPPSAEWIREAVGAVGEQQRAGRAERAWPLFRVLEPLVPGLGERDPASAGRVLGALATQALVEGDWEAFLERARRAAEAFERAGDVAAAADERASLGAGYRMLGAWEDAERALRAAITGGGDGGVAARARLDLARVLAGRGARAEARELATAAAASFAQAGEAGWEGAARALIAGMVESAGQGGVAEGRRAVGLLAASPEGRAFAGGALARALIVEGEMTAALDAAEQARGEGEAIGRLPEGDVPVRLALAEARGAAGDGAGAREALGEARRRVLADAAKLRDPGLRRAFLEGVPEHRRALEEHLKK